MPRTPHLEASARPAGFCLGRFPPVRSWLKSSSFFWSLGVSFPCLLLTFLFLLFFFFKIFLMKNSAKCLLNLLQYCFCFMFRFVGCEACGILAPRPGVKPAPLALEGQVLATPLFCPVHALVINTLLPFSPKRSVPGVPSTNLSISHISEFTLSSPRVNKKSVLAQPALSVVPPDQVQHGRTSRVSY